MGKKNSQKIFLTDSLLLIFLPINLINNIQNLHLQYQQQNSLKYFSLNENNYVITNFISIHPSNSLRSFKLPTKCDNT